MSLAVKRIWCWGAAALIGGIAFAFQLLQWAHSQALPPGVMAWVILAVILLTCIGQWIGPTEVAQDQVAAFEKSLNEVAEKSVSLLLTEIDGRNRTVEARRVAEFVNMLEEAVRKAHAAGYLEGVQRRLGGAGGGIVPFQKP